jgi:dihydroorotate dehydrogenase electron transfer subunit
MTYSANDTMTAPACRTLRVQEVTGPQNHPFYRMRLDSPGWSWRPGQFLMLRAEKWGIDPLCARPFSIADQDEDSLHIYWQAVGRMTRTMTELRPGDELTVWGPLGNGFEHRHDIPTLLLAGGMGIVPFIGLIRRQQQVQNLELIFGHRYDLDSYPYAEIADKVLTWSLQDTCQADLEKLGRALQVKIEGYSPDGRILACGPAPFLRMVQEIVLDKRARAQLSLETHMACGIGACLGCAATTRDGRTLKVCQDGPVFEAENIVI